jgi:hypothetical protein
MKLSQTVSILGTYFPILWFQIRGKLPVLILDYVCAEQATIIQLLHERFYFMKISVADPDPHVLGLPDPDLNPLVRGMDPDPDPSIIMRK